MLLGALIRLNLLVCAWEDQSKNQFHICHKASSLLYSNAIGHQAYCIANEVKQLSLMILARLYIYGFLPLLKWTYKENSQE